MDTRIHTETTLHTLISPQGLTFEGDLMEGGTTKISFVPTAQVLATLQTRMKTVLRGIQKLKEIVTMMGK